MSTPISLSIRTSFGVVPLRVEVRGDGPAVLLLHGGAGPASVAGFGDLLAGAAGVRVVVPTHPGFGGTTRPPALSSMVGLAEVYAGLLDALELDDAAVVGNSIGGWIDAELALLHPTRLGRIALVDAVGVEVHEHPAAAFDSLTPQQIAAHSWYDPSRSPVRDPATLPPSAREAVLGDRAALAAYGGTSADGTLLSRLSGIDLPALVLWGEADRIVDPEYGRAYAAAIPGARFELLRRTGHVPQLETPEALLDALRGFVTGHGSERA